MRSFRALCLAALLAGCSSGGGASEGRTERGPAVPVKVAAVVRRDAPVTLSAIGTVQAYSTVAVKAQVEGQLAQTHVPEGQEVRRGDLLFTIDQRPFEATLREAQATLAKDRASAEQARVDAGRLGTLISSGIVAREQYDQAQARAKAMAATVEADEAAVERARIQLEYCAITSPLDGRLGQHLVHVGNVVKANETTLATINQVRPIHVEFAVPQQELAAVRRRQSQGPVVVTANVPGPDGTQEPVAGELTFVNNAVDPATGTLLLKAAFPNAEENLWPGQVVNVALDLATRHDATLAPARAVQRSQDGQYVFVVQDDGTVASRPVTVGPTVGEAVVIERGLEPGERVVTEGQLRLAPGSRVEIAATEAG